jgi:hypothetical protein
MTSEELKVHREAGSRRSASPARVLLYLIQALQQVTDPSSLSIVNRQSAIVNSVDSREHP